MNNSKDNHKYKLSVGALFKNEAHCLKEWIEHYRFHMVSHFYLIDDSSTDNSLEVLEPYIKMGLVTIFNGNNWPYYSCREPDMYNNFIFPLIHETKWLLMCDLDEFMWSQESLHLTYILDQCEHLGQIQVDNTIFGSNGYIDQPKSLVSSFTKRSTRPTIAAGLGNRKYFINTSYKFTSLNIHHATFEDKNDEKNNFLLLDAPYFILNHYNCQSLEFWKNVKCTRGDGDNYRVITEEDFKVLDINEITDMDLFEQNKGVCFQINGHF